MNKKKLTSAIIGYGYMGQIRRREIEKSDNIYLSIICESDKTRSIENTEAIVTQDPKLVIDSDVDIVFICTPNYLIPDLTVKCLNSGKHVFCEKPPGRNIEDISAMKIAEANNPSLKLMFGFNHRFHPSILKAKSMIKSGRLGKIVALRGLYGKSGGKNFSNSWRNNFNISGGGILLDQGIHMLDLFNYFTGNFKKVRSFLSNENWGFEVEDNAMVILKNDKNQMATLHSSATFWKHIFQMDIILEHGYLIIEGLLSKSGSYGREKLTIGHQQFEDVTEAVGNPSEETIYFDKDLSWEIELGLFLNYILNNEPVSESNSNDALNAMEIVQKCYKKSELSIYSKGKGK
jgi:predicted dehydrogenase